MQGRRPEPGAWHFKDDCWVERSSSRKTGEKMQLIAGNFSPLEIRCHSLQNLTSFRPPTFALWTERHATGSPKFSPERHT
mmetsp:Transcript_3872/g.7414  ORF Transcript_3872/g.7414 Transcript_3872/m.7414 type:complete len:80 (-) Transcript_3872:144-383(-)